MSEKRLRVAFVGMRRDPSSLPPGYLETFLHYHLELPWYYAQHALCDVVVTTTEKVTFGPVEFNPGGTLKCMTEAEYVEYKGDFDVIVHWRKWFDDLYDPYARNVILSQDHTYGPEWIFSVKDAFTGGRLDGILVFPTWHKENTWVELGGVVPRKNLYEGLSLGVDTTIYFPTEKDRFSLLWASDPGRGLDRLINPFLRLWSKDRRYKLTVTYPDYVKPELVARFSHFLKHPGVNHIPGLRNGGQLWDLFNRAMFVPYSSSFMEPSSRCHRQGQAAGAVVLYPPNMGTPSHLIENGLTGIVEEPEHWPDIIRGLQESDRLTEISANARTFAVSENWAVQAKRFYDFFTRGK